MEIEDLVYLYQNTKKPKDSLFTQIWEQCQPIVYKDSQRVRKYKENKDDYYSVAKYWLLYAIDNFEKGKGKKFKTYFAHCIQSASSSINYSYTYTVRPTKTTTTEIPHFSYPEITGNYEQVNYTLLMAETLEKDEVLSIFNTLKGKEREVIDLYYGISSKIPLGTIAIAKKLKVTSRYILQIKDKALKTLRGNTINLRLELA